ncbi:putative microtubule-associated protein, MAP65/Ase1/PRC1 [Helianthus annuus]|nr:putative microtubule-associated protein, MAP65/Ase1/PRC1 [Helianthus annuus]
MQKIWHEVGESEEERNKMFLQLEQECLNVYKRKVDHAVKSKAHLLQALADANREVNALLVSLGEKSSVNIPDKTSGTIVDAEGREDKTLFRCADTNSENTCGNCRD